MFVKDYMGRTVMKQFGLKGVTGAFILDCVANWTPEPHSQVLYTIAIAYTVACKCFAYNLASY